MLSVGRLLLGRRDLGLCLGARGRQLLLDDGELLAGFTLHTEEVTSRDPRFVACFFLIFFLLCCEARARVC